MGNNLTRIDTPNTLVLSDMERSIIEALSSNKSAVDISMDMGIPKVAIVNLMRKPGVKAFIQELIDARNQLMKLQLSDLLMGIIDDRVAMNQEDEEKRLSNLSQRDIVELIKELNAMIKTTDSPVADVAEDKFKKIYQQINIIQTDAATDIDVDIIPKAIEDKGDDDGNAD